MTTGVRDRRGFMRRAGALAALLVSASMSVTATLARAADEDAERPGFPADPFPLPTTAVDVTARFDALVVGGRLDTGAVDRAFDGVRKLLEGVRVVIVPSLLVDLIRPAIAVGLVDYFGDQRKWLGSIGVESALAPTDTEASVASNGGDLARFIAASDKPLCIVSHSRGGLDTLVALSILSAEELSKVRCWIALQAPFAGSPLADMTTRLWLAHRLADLTLYVLQGSPRALDDLSTAARRQHPVVSDDGVRRVVSHVPTLAVTSILHPSDGFWPRSHFEPTRNLMAAGGIESDGIVPTRSAILPHARYVVLDGLDHGDTVDVECAPACAVEDDVTLLKALLAIALDGS